MEKLLHVLTKDFISCVHVRCYFFTAAHFHLAAAMKFSCFSSNEIRLLAPSLSIKNNVEKDTTLLLFFFLCKSPGGHAIFFRCIWVAIPVD